MHRNYTRGFITKKERRPITLRGKERDRATNTEGNHGEEAGIDAAEEEGRGETREDT